MSGAVVSAYQMFEASGRNQTRAMIQEEGDFLVAKMNWALSGLQSISTPPIPASVDTCATSTALSVSKWDTAIGTILVTQLSGNLTFAHGGNPAQVLNNSNVSISNLLFAHCFNGGLNPESVSVSFTLITRTPNGMLLTQDFSTSQYLRK